MNFMFMEGAAFQIKKNILLTELLAEGVVRLLFEKNI